MNLLAFDTSTERASIAVSNGSLLFTDEIVGVRSHAQQILVVIDQLMQQAQLTWPELDGIIFGQGPGSFTGLRVACSVAKGLAFAHDCPVYPVGSLATIRAAALAQPQNFDTSLACLVMMDARMQQVYWAYFSDKSAMPQPQVNAVEDIVIPGQESIGLIGCGWESYRSQLSSNIQQRIMRAQEIYPDAATMIQLVKTGKVKAVSAQEASPLYIRDQVTQ